MRAAFFDIDGTLTKDRSWKGFLDYFSTHKLKRATHIGFLCVHYPIYFSHRLGIVTASQFRGIWAANMAWYVRSFSVEQADKVWDWSVEHFLNQHWRTDTRVILDEHLRAGDPVVLVSSAPEPLTRRIAAELGTEHAVGTPLEFVDGRYTGRSKRPICIGKYKPLLAQEYLRRKGLEVDLDSSCAYADSISDL